MSVLRTDIEKALDELISNEQGMKFQGLVVILAKQKWPELVACERKKDLGLDAYASASLAKDRIGRGLACSLTATLNKIRADAIKIKKNFDDVEILIFATPKKVTNSTARLWADKIHKEFGYKLIVVPREDIIISLMLPSNAPLCLMHLSIPVAVEEAVEELIGKSRDATADMIAEWLAHPRLIGKPLIALQASKLDQEGRDTGEILDLKSIRTSLNEGRRVILEAPAGRGKTTTVIQLAKRISGGDGLAFLIDLPAWAKSGLDILDFVSRMPSFRSRNIDAVILAKLYNTIHVSFLLNGWNEISEIHSEGASVALRQLERTFPAAGIIVATRTHHISPPLPGAFRAKLLPLTRSQRGEYLHQSLGKRADELRSKLDNSASLDDLTRTPLILAEVVTIFQSGGEIPTTKIGVLDAVMHLMENSDEHRNYLQAAPLSGHAYHYLAELAIQLLGRGDTTITDEEARIISNNVSVRLRDSGQLATLPEPGAVLTALCAHHVLERLDYPSDVFRFEHQQFQEFYAALLIKRQLWEIADKDDQSQSREFAKQYVNEPAWEEPLCMVAEEIGVRSAAAHGGLDIVRAGKRLIEMALGIDPIFAAELSHSCGEVVWKEVGGAVGHRLRSWYGLADENHKQCALAGMVATGSADFIDIILPLLTSNDQQVRLRTYRVGTKFHLSSLGPGWRNIVRGWSEDARIEFIWEVTGDRWMPEIVKDFALGDPSFKVRAEAVRALSWVGSDQDIAKLLEALDEDAFELAVRRMNTEDIPLSLYNRALAIYQKVFSESRDPLTRLRFLIKAAEFGETGIAEKIKHELSSFPFGTIDDTGEYVIKTAIEMLQKADQQWSSDWVVGRILDGSPWRQSWIGLVTNIPEALRERLLQKVFEEIQPVHSRQIAALAAIADSSVAETFFSKLSAIKHSIFPRNSANQAICRQLEDFIRALPPNIAVAGLSSSFDKELDAIEFTVVIHAFSTVARYEEPDLRLILREDLRQGLRRYLKSGLNFILKQDDFSGELKAHLASALARVGEPEDIPDLTQLIKADIKRVRKGRAARIRGERSELANGGFMSYANWHVTALTSLDSESVEAVLLDVLNEPEYENEASSALLHLARTRNTEKPFAIRSRDYSVIWEARAGRGPFEFDEERRRRYATAIKLRINALLDERAGSIQRATYDGRLKSLAKVLAILDSYDSAELVLQVMAFPGEWDGWVRVEALESLLFNGIPLPTEATLKVLNPTIEHTLTQGNGISLLTKCLCLLPFLDDPSVGFARLKQIISETNFPIYELRSVITAVGSSRSNEALPFLQYIAASLGDKLGHIVNDWIKAVAAVGSMESKGILLSFIEGEVSALPTEVSFNDRETDLLASCIADMALTETEIKPRILQVCDTQLSPIKRILLSKVIARLGTLDAIIAGLSLIEDNGEPSVPYDLQRAIKGVFLKERPFRNTGSFTIVPQGSKDIIAKLFEMVTTDNRRKQAAFALLGQIEVWRLEHGRPTTEPRHPAFDSGEMWPPNSMITSSST
jgi:HEAT repeat protein